MPRQFSKASLALQLFCARIPKVVGLPNMYTIPASHSRLFACPFSLNSTVFPEIGSEYYPLSTFFSFVLQFSFLCPFFILQARTYRLTNGRTDMGRRERCETTNNAQTDMKDRKVKTLPITRERTWEDGSVVKLPSVNGSFLLQVSPFH